MCFPLESLSGTAGIPALPCQVPLCAVLGASVLTDTKACGEMVSIMVAADSSHCRHSPAGRACVHVRVCVPDLWHRSRRLMASFGVF